MRDGVGLNPNGLGAAQDGRVKDESPVDIAHVPTEFLFQLLLGLPLSPLRSVKSGTQLLDLLRQLRKLLRGVLSILRAQGFLFAGTSLPALQIVGGNLPLTGAQYRHSGEQDGAVLRAAPVLFQFPEQTVVQVHILRQEVLGNALAVFSLPE